MKMSNNNMEIGYKIHLENGNEFNSSIFKTVYNNAKENVIEIIRNTSHSQIHKSYNDDYNNIIAFTGERGRGKSSTMISFLESIVNKSKDVHKLFFSEDETNAQLFWSNYNFTTIDVIDPTLFREREKETLFEIVIAKMFSAFRRAIENKDTENSIIDEQRRSVIKYFQKVFEDLKYLKNRDAIFNEDALDALIKLSTSSNLKESFDSLVDEYLKVLGKSEKTNFLIIAIDDFDLKIDGVYEMLEDVRRFLISRKIILLISCKMEQMREALELPIKKIGVTKNASNQIEKYIEKLFPASRQIVLPQPSKLSLNNNRSIESEIYEYNYLFNDLFFSYLKHYSSIFSPDTLRSYYGLISLIKTENGIYLREYILNFLRNNKYYRNVYYKIFEFAIVDKSSVLILYVNILQYMYEHVKNNLKQDNESQKQKGDIFGLFISKEETERQKQEENLLAIFKTNNINNLRKSELLSAFLLLDNFIDQKDFNQCCLLHTVKCMFEIDYAEAESPDGDQYKLNYGISPAILPSKYRLSNSKIAKKSRDLFRINFPEKSWKFENTRILFSAFYEYFGHENELVYLSDSSDYFERKKEWDTGNRSLKYFQFNLYNILHAVNDFSLKYKNMFEGENTSSSINQSIIEYKETNYFKLFNSSSFCHEFLLEFVPFFNELFKGNSVPKTESNLENYYEYIKTGFEKGIEKTFTAITKKYEYLKLDSKDFIRKHPFINLLINSIEENREFEIFINNSFNSLQENNLPDWTDDKSKYDMLRGILDFLEEKNSNGNLKIRSINTLKNTIEDRKIYLNDSDYTILFNIVNRRARTSTIQSELIDTIKQLIHGQSTQND